MLPYSIDSSLILYRKDILDKGGVAAPKTWDELYDAAAKLQKPPELYGVGFQLNPAGTDAESTYYYMGLSFGAMPVSADGKTPTFDTPEMLTLVNYVKKQWDRGVYPPGVTGWDNAANNASLQDEKTIFINNPASPLVWFRDNKPEMLPKIGVAAMPAGPTGKAFMSAYVRDGFALFKSTPDARQALAKDLMRRLYSKEVYTKWIELAFPSPAVQGLENLDIWKNPQRAGFLEAAKNGVLSGYPGPLTPAWAEFGTRTPYLAMLARVIVEKWEPKKAIEEQDKVMKEIYAKYK
jgi:ABC-type glycerol-3-phosphate transport system substrate-binding protein